MPSFVPPTFLEIHHRCQKATDFIEAALRDRFGKKHVVRQGCVILDVRGAALWLSVCPAYDEAGRPTRRLVVRWRGKSGAEEFPDPARSTIGVLVGQIAATVQPGN
jgi:hypothetical protein